MTKQRPIILGIVGDSAAGKTTITSGLVKLLGPDRVTHVCADDYHKYDRHERKVLNITALHPDCNYLDILELHLERLHYGQPILKPVYDHSTGSLVRPEYIQPREFVIVEGLLGFTTATMRQFYDVKVYLNPPEDLRRVWKIKRDTTKRGYTAAEVMAELEKRLDELVLRASRDGIVQMAVNPIAGRKYLAGDQAIPSWVVASLPELGTMQVHGRLSDVDDGAVRSGMQAECTLDAYPQRRFRGSLHTVSPMARSEGRDVTRRFFDVIVTLDEAPPALLRPGMSVRVEVIRRRVSDATLVPRAALVGGPRPDGKAQVRRLSGELQTIEVDFCSELTCAVRAGLSQGSRLAAPLPTDRGSL